MEKNILYYGKVVLLSQCSRFMRINLCRTIYAPKGTLEGI